MLDDGRIVRVVGNHFVNGNAFDLPFSLEELGLKEKVYYPIMKELIETYSDPKELKKPLKKEQRNFSKAHYSWWYSG